jgi:hypothetical protein
MFLTFSLYEAHTGTASPKAQDDNLKCRFAFLRKIFKNHFGPVCCIKHLVLLLIIPRLEILDEITCALIQMCLRNCLKALSAVPSRTHEWDGGYSGFRRPEKIQKKMPSILNWHRI